MAVWLARGAIVRTLYGAPDQRTMFTPDRPDRSPILDMLMVSIDISEVAFS
jgi:hypothetical protein